MPSKATISFQALSLNAPQNWAINSPLRGFLVGSFNGRRIVGTSLRYYYDELQKKDQREQMWESVDYVQNFPGFVERVSVNQGNANFYDYLIQGMVAGSVSSQYLPRLVQENHLDPQSAGAVAIQTCGISLHRHFNHNDLYHVIQMGGIYLFYRGALELKDR